MENIIRLTVIIIFAAVFVYVGIPFIYGRVTRLSLRRKIQKYNVLVLTFDDGPGTRLTPDILKILADHNVKATFFLLGRNIPGREKIVRQIAAEGHEVCSHGYDHINYWYTCPFRALADIKRGWQAIDSALDIKQGRYSFRPPYGKLNIITLLYLWGKRVPVILWTLVLGDTHSEDNSDEYNISSLIKDCGGAVLLVHDFDRADDRLDSKIIQSLCCVLQTAKEENISTVTVSELLNKE